MLSAKPECIASVVPGEGDGTSEGAAEGTSVAAADAAAVDMPSRDPASLLRIMLLLRGLLLEPRLLIAPPLLPPHVRLV